MTPPSAAAMPAVRPAPARRSPAPGRRPSAPPRRPPAPGRRSPAPTRHGSAPARTAPASARRQRTIAGEQSSVVGRLLDRTIASRAWIGLVAFALIGIVAMQLWLLKLNTGIGRAIEHEALLQRTNAALSAEDSALSAGDLVESKAATYGMTTVPSGGFVFLGVRGALDERQAAARLAQPVSSPQASAGTAASAGSQSGSPSQALAGTTTPSSTEAGTTIPSSTEAGTAAPSSTEAGTATSAEPQG